MALIEAKFARLGGRTIFGHIDTIANRRPRHAIANRPAVEAHLSAVEEISLEHAGDDLGGLRAGGADQSKDPGDLARKHRERTVFDDWAHGKVLDAQNLAARRPAPCRVELFRKIAADHRSDDLGTVEILGGFGYHVFAVAQDRDSIEDLQGLLDGVGDEDDRYATLARTFDQ